MAYSGVMHLKINNINIMAEQKSNLSLRGHCDVIRDDAAGVTVLSTRREGVRERLQFRNYLQRFKNT